MNFKILTVDDSKTIRMIVKKAFKQFNCELCEAENGVEGLVVASREKPDLIVLDITMPVMDGKEMLAKLKQDPSLQDIPVIMLTAESGKDNVMEIVQAGVKEYMVKPFKAEELIQRAGKLIKLEPKKVEAAGQSEKSRSSKFMTTEDGIQYLVLPSAVNQEIIAEISSQLKNDAPKPADIAEKKLIFDLSRLQKINISIIKLIIMVIEKCQKTQTGLKVVGNCELSSQLQGFQETAQLPVYLKIEEARASFSPA